MAGTCVEPEIPQGPTVSIESWYLSPSISDRKAQLLFHADITATHPERGCVRAVAPVNAPGAVGSLGRRGAGAGYSKGGTKNKDWRQQLRRHEADAARPTPRGPVHGSHRPGLREWRQADSVWQTDAIEPQS